MHEYLIPSQYKLGKSLKNIASFACEPHVHVQGLGARLESNDVTQSIETV